MSLWQGRASKAVGAAVLALAVLAAPGSLAFARDGHGGGRGHHRGGYYHGGGYRHGGDYHRGYRGYRHAPRFYYGGFVPRHRYPGYGRYSPYYPYRGRVWPGYRYPYYRPYRSGIYLGFGW